MIGVAVEVGDRIAVGGDHHRLVLAEFDSVAGVFDERRDIGADEHLAVADAEYQRSRAPGGHDRPRLVGVGENQREVALEAAQHGQHGGDEVAGGVTAPVLAGDQVHGDLGVGVAGESHAGGFQFVAQRRVVLDDPVVDDRDLAGGIAVRVCVAVRGPAVGSPAGVAHPGVPAQRYRVGGVQRGFQVGQPPGTAAHRQTAATVDQGDTGGVVAAVLHSAQCIDHHIAGGTVPDVTDDSTHSAYRTAPNFRHIANLSRFAEIACSCSCTSDFGVHIACANLLCILSVRSVFHQGKPGVIPGWCCGTGMAGWAVGVGARGEPLLHQANCALLALASPRLLDAAACVSSAASERMTPHHSGFSHILANVRQALSAGRGAADHRRDGDGVVWSTTRLQHRA